MPNVAYRGADYPLILKRTGGTPTPKYYYLSRIQDFGANESMAAQNVYEIGTDGPIGATSEAARYSASLSWVPYNMTMFKVLRGLDPNASGEGNTSVSLAQMMANDAGIELHGASIGIQGAVPQSISISAAVRQAASGSVSFRGTGLIEGGSLMSLAAIETGNAHDIYHENGTNLRFKKTVAGADLPVLKYLTGAAYSSFMHDEIKVKKGTTLMARAQRVQIQAGFTVDETEEQGHDGVVSTDANTPVVTATIDFLEGDSTPDAGIPFATPADLVIEFGTSFSITLEDVFSNSRGVRSQVRGYATRQYSYMVKEAGTSGGMIIAAL